MEGFEPSIIALQAIALPDLATCPWAREDLNPGSTA